MLIEIKSSFNNLWHLLKKCGKLDGKISLLRRYIMELDKLSMGEWHKRQAILNFNGTWDLVDKKERTKDEDLKMIHMAHASRFHWGEIGTPLEFERGEWQISRVYSLLGMGESALYHAGCCLALCQENQIGDFDLAFAHEALARGYMVSGNREMMNKHLDLARQAAEQIEKEDDKKYFLSEMKNIRLD